MLNIKGCRARQQRLLDVLEREGLDGALITQRAHVYYFSGYLAPWNHAPAAWLNAQGRLTLVSERDDGEGLAVDECAAYPAQKMCTMQTDQAARSAAVLGGLLPKGQRLGVDLEGRAALARLAGAEAFDLTPALLRLRKKKDPDELACLREAIDVSEIMHGYAKAAMEPGQDEIELFAELRATATRAADADLERFGNDFRSGAGGGPARRRAMLDGELYILDAGPCLHGYHADNCRTFAVNGVGSRTQRAACEKIIACLRYLEGLIKPGLSGAECFAAAKEFLADAGHSGLCHHLGHGIGLQPHEAPQLNPEYDCILEPGDVFTLEPGLYSDELNAGIRLEEDYVLTEKGLEKLTHFPLGLT